MDESVDIRVTVADRELTASWTDDAPETRAALEDALPVSGDATRWGDELYFSMALDAPAENAREVVPSGAITYWPARNCVCSGGRPPRASTTNRGRRHP